MLTLQSYVDNYLALNSGPAAVKGKSIVVHFANKTVIACANLGEFASSGSGTGLGSGSGSSGGSGSGAGPGSGLVGGGSGSPGSSNPSGNDSGGSGHSS